MANLVPVQGNPFEQVKLTPVQGDPFAQPKQPQGMLSRAGQFVTESIKDIPEAGLGMLDAAASVVSGIGAEPVAGLAGILSRGRGLARNPESAGDVVNKVREWGTWQPRTERGQEYLQNVGKVIEPIGRELQATERMLGEGAMELTGSPAVAAAATAIPTALMEATGLVAARAASIPKAGAMLEGNFRVIEPSTTQAAIEGRRSNDLSVGAAQTPKDLERAAVSQNFPVPFEGESALTRGQITRNFEQLQFEKEAAKAAETGAPLRNRVENQTETLIQNLDAFADLSQPMRYELRDIGQNVDRALTARRDRLQKRVNRLYQAARDRGELRQPVQMNTIPEMLNDIQRFEGVAPNAAAIRREALRLGAVVDEAGNLNPGTMTIDDAELFRQFVNASTNIADPREARIRRIAISAIDDATEGAGGDVYAAARRARSEMMTEFENVGLTRRLLSTKNGTSERAIAYEDVFKKVMLDSSIEETNKLRSTLLRAGDEGKQAWADLKARGINYIKENALSSSQTDSRGNAIISVDKLNRAIKSMDEKGKLESIYGKRNAQAIRDLGDMAKYIYTAPPGAINHSNTASALMVALDSLGTFAVTGVPAPVVSALRQGSRYVKDARTRKRINESLNYLSENRSSSPSIKSSNPNLRASISAEKSATVSEPKNPMLIDMDEAKKSGYDTENIIYSGSSQKEIPDKIYGYGENIKGQDNLFGGIFGSFYENIAQSHGNQVKRLVTKSHISDDDFARIPYQKDITGDMKKMIKEAKYETITDSEADEIFDFMSGKKNIFDDEPDMGRERFEEIIGKSDDGDISWDLQGLKGELARRLGYTSVGMADEHGESVLALIGSKFLKDK